MKLAWLRLVSMAAVAPLAVSTSSPHDSAVTSISVGVGAGSYADVTRGCNNSVLSAEQRRFRDAGVDVRHDFPGPPEIGLRATLFRKMPDYKDGTVLWNPHVALEWRAVGIGLGYITNGSAPGAYDPDYKLSDVTGHLRLGPREKSYFSIHLAEDVPMVSSGGVVRAGIGMRPGPLADIWFGAGGKPYDRAGLVTMATFHAHKNADINVAGRLGGVEGLSENAIALGVTFKFPWRGSAIPPE